MEYDIIPQITVNKLKRTKTFAELIAIKQTADMNPNFDKAQKQYVRGFADAMINQKHKTLFKTK